MVSIVAVLVVSSLGASMAAGPSATLRTGKPLKVHILVGQSNMQWRAMESTLAGPAMDPETKPIHDKLASGFTRLECPDYGHERLLVFTCKTRHFCPDPFPLPEAGSSGYSH